MASETISAEKIPLISRSAANEAFRGSVRLFVGRGRRYSVPQVAKATGISERMLYSFTAPVDSTDFRKPDLEEVLTLSAFLGPDFTTELLSLANQGAFWLPDDGEPDPARMSADAAEDTATIARAAADGIFDRDEKRHLSVVGRRKIERGMQLVASAARAA